MFKFIHSADIHIDSPLRGLEAYEGAPIEQIRSATRKAFEQLVDLAIENEVAFVIIAGDLFDGRWQDMQTGLWTARQFRRLESANIRLYLIRGNHDAASKVRSSITWPGNVFEFSTRKPQTFQIEPLRVALHGQGFAKQECLDDLASQYPDAVRGWFNIGVLHTSLTGDATHDTYAPTSLSVLHSRHYNYWALGHIHQRSNPQVYDKPYIAYSGNTQGRHVNETGPKGCLLVTVDDEIQDVEFLPTDVLRWYRLEISLDENDNVTELLTKVQTRLAECHDQSGGRFSAVRLELRGACKAHQRLVKRADREETLAEIRNIANDLDEEIWIEKIRLETRPLANLNTLRQGQDLLGGLLRDIDHTRNDDKSLATLAGELTALESKASIELKAAGIDLSDLDQLRIWLTDAESMLVSRLSEALE